MSRKRIIAGNWKMNKTVKESVVLAQKIVQGTSSISNFVEVIIAPTYLALVSVASIISESSIKLAAQDVHFEDDGAFTGKISVSMLKDIGVEYVILGHSEQRMYFGETDKTLALK